MATKGFICVGKSLVRLDAITRLADEKVAGTPGVQRYFVHLTDGGFLAVSELDYKKIKNALIGQAKLRKPAREVLH